MWCAVGVVEGSRPPAKTGLPFAVGRMTAAKLFD
jgi:hypothetical protein